MKKRLDSMQRVLSVQRHMRQLAEAKLAELQRREATLEKSREELIGALNGDTALHGLFTDAMARRVRSVSKEIAALERSKEDQTKRLLEQTGRLKSAERAASSIEREYRAHLEKRDLADLIDTMKPPADKPA
jgi:hypothetical protein